MILKLLKQSSDYNCGVYALHLLLQCHGVVTDLEVLELALKTTEEEGTSHTNITDYLADKNIVAAYDASLKQLSAHLPAMVNYQYTGEGHYSVVLSITPQQVILYNPDLGALEAIASADFERVWYSELYGNKWFLSLK